MLRWRIVNAEASIGEIPIGAFVKGGQALV